MTSHDDKAASFWDREVADPRYQSWMTHPHVRHYINGAISGSPHDWPLDWFRSFLAGRTFRRGLSIGCGSGALERDLAGRGLVDRIDAFDGSSESIRMARQEAEKAGYAEQLRYTVANFNEPSLPRRAYDVVFAHQSLHHVAKLEKLFRAVLAAMKPDGLFYLDEYVGPSRHDWTGTTFAAHRAIFEMIPDRLRYVSVLPLPIESEDPSEAIRSNEILPELRVGFDVVERRDYGGNLLAPIFQYIDSSTEGADALVDSLIVAEQELLSAGQESFYTVIVARPKRGVAASLANLRYFAVPKAKRVGRELRRVTARGR